MSLKPLRHFAVISGLLVALTGAAGAASINLAPHADTYLRDATIRGALAFMDVRGGSNDFRGYLRFDLGSIPSGATLTGATLSLKQATGASRNDVVTNARFALYGLDNVAGNTTQTWDEATFVIGDKGTEDVTTLTGVTDLDDNVAGITETVMGGGTTAMVTVTGGPLTGFLQTRLGDGGLATFILSNDDSADRGFGIGTKENSDPLLVSSLSIEYTIPEPATGAMCMAAALAAMLYRRRQ
jgi:hypothetical protein